MSAIIGFSYASFTTDSSKTGSIQTISDSYCMDNEIYKLSDCIKAQNANTTNIQTAESIIEARTYDTTVTSPVISNIYEKKVISNTTMPTSYNIYYSSLDDLLAYSNSEPEFIASTGKYQFIYSGEKSVQELIDDSTSGHPKYICKTTAQANTTCNYIYVLNEVTYNSSKQRYEPTSVDLFTNFAIVQDNTSGLFAADDYNNTKTYFF